MQVRPRASLLGTPSKLTLRLSGNKKQQLFCRTLFSDLKHSSTTITYPEPIVRTDDLNEPVFQKYLGCEGAEDAAGNNGYPGYFASIKGEIGTKGFKVYELNLDRQSTTGKHEVIYGEYPLWMNAPAKKGYYVIKVLKDGECKYERSVGITIQYRPNGHEAANISAIIKYRGAYFTYALVMYPNNKDFDFQIFKLSASTVGIDPTLYPLCDWESTADNRGQGSDPIGHGSD